MTESEQRHLRLKKSDRAMIVDQVQALTGERTEVKLFGSRLDPDAGGGDVDLLIILHHAIENPVSLAAKLSVKLMQRMAGRKVDILLDAPNLQTFPIHRIARKEGVSL